MPQIAMLRWPWYVVITVAEFHYDHPKRARPDRDMTLRRACLLISAIVFFATLYYGVFLIGLHVGATGFWANALAYSTRVLMLAVAPCLSAYLFFTVLKTEPEAWVVEPYFFRQE